MHACVVLRVGVTLSSSRLPDIKPTSQQDKIVHKARIQVWCKTDNDEGVVMRAEAGLTVADRVIQSAHTIVEGPRT